MGPLHSFFLKINTSEVFFSAIHTVWTLWSCIYHEFKDTLEEKWLKWVFQNHFAFTHGLYIHVCCSMNALVFIFAALAEVQVAIFSVFKNLPQQESPATYPLSLCCVCSPLLFASEIVCNSPGDLPTYSKQRINKISPSQWPCCLETQNARWCQAEWHL